MSDKRDYFRPIGVYILGVIGVILLNVYIYSWRVASYSATAQKLWFIIYGRGIGDESFMVEVYYGLDICVSSIWSGLNVARL